MRHFRQTIPIVLLLAWIAPVHAVHITVRDASELQKALPQARPGTTIILAPGNYGTGLRIEKVNGTKINPIVITAMDDQDRPVFIGGKVAIHLTDCSYITLSNIRVTGCTVSGINADDGGRYDPPSRGLVFENISIEDIGPMGNRDGLKLSGLNDFMVTHCTLSGWGGSAIDMVGCSDGVIHRCMFIGKEGFSQITGIQAKGGSERILIRQNFFKNAGQRAVNLGGSTGLKFFRPKLRDYEAKAIVVAGNHFIGSTAPIAYATSTNCVVRQNTFIYPEKWVMRILQEQPTDTFKPCREGVFEANLVVFDRRVQTVVNVGQNTKAETFSFRENAWFCTDGNRRPKLPSQEIKGVYQIDPMLKDAETPDMEVGSRNSRLRGIGAHAFEVEDADAEFPQQINEQDAPADADKPRR